MWIQRGMEEIIWLDKVTYEEVSVGQVGMSTSHPFYGNYTGCPFDAASTSSWPRSCTRRCTAGYHGTGSTIASRRLRLSDTFTFAVPRTRTRLGDRSFAVVGPQIWNSLPADLRLVDNYARFRRLLKEHWLRLRRLVTLLFLGAV